MVSQIAGQLTQWHLESAKVIEIKQVVINTVRIDAFLVELEMCDGEGINAWIVINEKRSPRLNDLPQFIVKVLTEQSRQRCVFTESRLC